MRLLSLTYAALQIIRITYANQRYPHIIINDADHNLLNNIPDLDLRNPECIWSINNHSYEQIELDNSEATLVNATPSNTTITANKINDQPIENADICNNDGIMCGIPACKTKFKHTAVVLDSFIDNTRPEFNNINVSYGINYAGGTIYGTKHGTKVCWIIAGGSNTFTTSGVKCHGITIFNDNGRGVISSLFAGLRDATEYCNQEEALGNTCGINFSGTGQHLTAIDTAFKDFASTRTNTARITTVAAGNNHDMCSNYSPAAAGEPVWAVGSTTLNSVEPASFTNWGCKDYGDKMLFLPGTILTPSFVNNLMSYFSGTSGSSPLLHRVLVGYQAVCKSCSMQEIKSAVYRRALEVMPPSDSHVKTPMYLISTNNACPADNYQNFCMSFKAKLVQNKRNVFMLVGVGDFAFRIGRYIKNSPGFTHDLISLKNNNLVLTKAITQNRMLYAQTFGDYQVGFNKKTSTLFFAKRNNTSYNTLLIAQVNISNIEDITLPNSGAIKFGKKQQCIT